MGHNLRPPSPLGKGARFPQDELGKRTKGRRRVYARKGTFRVEAILAMVPEPQSPGYTWEPISEHRVKMGSRRYKVFKQNLTCVGCGLKGRYFALERQKTQALDREDPNLHWHFNLYGINHNGMEILFTKDHIFPKSRGGSDSLHNLQTMCSPCNHQKADTPPNGATQPTVSKPEKNRSCSLESLKDDFRYDFFWEIRFYKSLPKSVRKVLVREALGLGEKEGTYLLRDGWETVLQWVRDNTLCHPFRRLKS